MFVQLSQSLLRTATIADTGPCDEQDSGREQENGRKQQAVHEEREPASAAGSLIIDAPRFPHKLAELREADKLEIESQPGRQAQTSTMFRVLGRRASHTVVGHSALV